MISLTVDVITHDGAEDTFRVTLDIDGVGKVIDDLTEVSFNGMHTTFRLVREHKETGKAEVYYIHDVDIVEFHDVDWGEDDEDDEDDAEAGRDDGSGYTIVDDFENIAASLMRRR